MCRIASSISRSVIVLRPLLIGRLACAFNDSLRGMLPTDVDSDYE
jgi:hypothetical protein